MKRKLTACAIALTACTNSAWDPGDEGGRADQSGSVELHNDVTVKASGTKDDRLLYFADVPEGAANLHVRVDTGLEGWTEQGFCALWRWNEPIYDEAGNIIHDGFDDLHGCNHGGIPFLVLEDKDRYTSARSEFPGRWNVAVEGFDGDGYDHFDLDVTLHYDKRINKPTQFATQAKAFKLGGQGSTGCDEGACGGDPDAPQNGFGWLDSSSELDFFTFNLNSSDDECVEYEIVPPSDMDVVVTVYGLDGQELQRIDNASTGELERLEIDNARDGGPGRYYWSVESSTGESVNPYFVDQKDWDGSCSGGNS